MKISTQMSCSSSGHRCQGCCFSSHSHRNLTKLSLCINMNATNMPLTETVENFSEAFGSLNYALSYPEKAVHEAVLLELMTQGVFFLLFREKIISSLAILILVNYIYKRRNRGKYTECSV